MRHYCITCKHLICIECIVDHSGHEFVRKEESSKIFIFPNRFLYLAFILKENGENIVKALEKLNERTEILLKEGFSLTKDMKQKKIRDMKMIDDVFERIIKKIMLKKA